MNDAGFGFDGDNHSVQRREERQQELRLVRPDDGLERNPPQSPHSQQTVEGVEGRESSAKSRAEAKAKADAERKANADFVWEVGHGQRRNYSAFGRKLAESSRDLYRVGCGLVQAKAGTIRHVGNGRAFASLIADTLSVVVTKDGSVTNDMIQSQHRDAMLGSDVFLDNFPKLQTHSTLPVYLDDFTLAKPGFNDGLLYLGEAPVIGTGTAVMDRFLGAMAWASGADKTNAVAAALTVLLRHHWTGEKPVVLVTGTKSHCGKGTVTDFFTGRVPTAGILYETTDWPMQQQLQRQLGNKPETGVIGFDNVRQDSSGRAKFIRSGFLESLITSPAVDLAAPGAGEAATWKNQFVVTVNTNDGCFSPDLLNRSLPIHLAPPGDVAASGPIGNPKLEYLPAHRHEIEAELRGIIERWRSAGMPLDNNVKHPMIRWARTVGGILAHAGYRDFLANYGTNRTVADPVKEALTILAGAAKVAKPNPDDWEGDWARPGQWAVLVKHQGLVGKLIPSTERENDKSRERAIGVLFSKHLGETFEVVTENESYRVRLRRLKRRWKESEEPHNRYAFERVAEEA